MKKKFLALLMAAALCVSMLPTTLLADVEESAEDASAEDVETTSETSEGAADSVAAASEDVEAEGEEIVMTDDGTASEAEVVSSDAGVISSDAELETSDAEAESEDEESETNDYIYDGESVQVTVSLPGDSEVPEDAELLVTSLDEENEEYDDLMENAADVITDGTIGEILFYDISFYSADGEYLPVDEEATVTIAFKQDAFPVEGSTHVIHFDSDNDNEANDISGVNKKQNDDGDATAVNFETDGFSVFAVADVMQLAEGDADLYINYAHIDLGYSGTSPFDEGSNNTDGNDESATNDIIRSFDRAGYNMTVDIDSKTESSDAKAVRIWFELNIQGSDIENEFYTQGFSWADHYELTDTDSGHTIKGYYDFKDDNGVAAGQKSGLSMVVQVLAMSDGMILQPTGKVWLEELDEAGEGTGALSESIDLDFPALEVSAKLQLNVYLYQGGTNVNSVEGTFGFASGGEGYINYDKGTSIYGRMYGYGLALEMYNSTTGKGMKGQALPDGDTIDLSVNLNSTFKEADDYGGKTLDLATYDGGNYQLLFYAIEGNTSGNSTCADGRSLISVDGEHPSSYYSRHVPYNKATSSQLGVNGVENGGSWTAKDQEVAEGGTTVNIQVDSYEITQLLFPYSYPDNSSANAFYTKGTAVEDIDCAVFSAGELWLIQPYSYVDSTGTTHDLSLEAGKGTFTIEVKDGVVDETPGTFVTGSYDSYDQNVTRDSDGNIVVDRGPDGKINYGTKATYTVDTQVHNTDDNRSQTAEINPPGNFANEIKYIDTAKNNAFTNVQGIVEAAGSGTGVSYATLGYDNVSVCGGFSYTPNTRANITAAANIMVKFDASVLSIKDEDWLSFPRYDGFSDNPDYYSIFFGYLSDGKNWESDTAMQEADEDDITWSSERRSDAACVAVLFEYRRPGSTTGLTRPRPSIAMNVLTDSDLSGSVYMTTEVTRLWTVSDVADAYNKEKGTDITYSDVINDTDGSQYIRTSIPSVAEQYGSTANLPEPSYGYGSGYEYNTPSKGSVYHKKEYNEDGTTPGHNGGDYYGDSLLILKYTSDVDLRIAQEATDQQTGSTVDKSIYNFDNAERVADLEVTGSMEIQNNVETSSWGDTITTVTVTVPEGASYIPNSAQYGIADEDGDFEITYTQSSTQGQQGTVTNGTSYQETADETVYKNWLEDESATGGMVYISFDDEGNQVLTFSVKGVPIQGKDVVRIYFSVELGDETNPDKDLKNNSSLTFDATIRTTEDKDRATSGNNKNEDTTTIIISETGSNTFSKYALNTLNEVNEDLSWVITWDNTSYDTAAMCEILDDMPDNDMPTYPSEYNGTYEISGFQIDLEKISPEDAQNLTVYYTMDKSEEGDELVLEHDQETGEAQLQITWDEITTQWKTLAVSKDGTVDFSELYEYEYDSEGKIIGVKNEVYAWAIGGSVPAGEGVHVTLTVHQYGALGGDYMTNVAYDSTGSSVFHRAATAYRALRTISGTVWLDEDMDGGINTGVYYDEQKINGVQVQLQVKDKDGNWVDAEDVYGENFEVTTQLDPKGYYEFTNLGAGTYRVLFKDDDTGKYEQNYMLSDHMLTTYEAPGIQDADNSKAKAFESNAIRPFADGDDYQGVISDIELPSLSEMTIYGYVYEVPYQNAGYTKTVPFAVEKSWKDIYGNDVSSKVTTESVTVKVAALGQEKLSHELILTEENDWKGTINDMVYYDGTGNPLDYTVEGAVSVKEIDGTEGYDTDVGDVTENDDGSYSVGLTNIKQTITFEGTKVWTDADNQDGKRPETITINLEADGDLVRDDEGNPITATIYYPQTKTSIGKVLFSPMIKYFADDDDPNTWSWAFVDEEGNLLELPVYNESGEKIEYTVVETTVDGYTTEITQNDDGSYIVANDHITEKTDLTVLKIWDDAGNQDGKRPEDITVELVKDGTATGDTIELDESNNWEGSFTELDKYKDGGTEIKYTVEELEIADYTSKIEGDATTGYVITNTHEPETVDVAGTKTWDDENDKYHKRPKSVTLYLLADGVPAVDEEGNPISVTVTEEDDWTYTFTGLNKYRDGGIEIEYTVLEEMVEDYEPEYDGYDITNNFIPEKIAVTVNKYWEDEKNWDGIRPDSVTVELLENGEPTGKTLKLNEDNNWQGTFSDLVLYDGGELVDYSVQEVDVPDGYTSTLYPADPGDGEGHHYVFAFVNEHNIDMTDVEVHKFWDDADDQDGIRPTSIDVTLTGTYEEGGMQKECYSETKTLDASTDWTAEFYQLPVNQPEGNEVTYTVTEVTETEGYTTSPPVMTKLDDGSYLVEVTNTHEPETIDIEGSKTWDDKNNQDGARPESITIRLWGDGAIVDTQTITPDEKGDWTWSFTGLPKYNKGVEITYNVTEDIVPDYSTTYDDEYGVTNSYIPKKTSVTVLKVWDDSNNEDGVRPDDITVKLLADGEETGETRTLDESNNWEGSFTELDKYKDGGTEIEYTVEELEIADYTSKIEGDATTGYVITNTHEPETVDVEGSKTWDDNNDQDGVRPDYITVHLFAGGEELAYVNVTEKENWSWSFTGLPKYEDGEEIVYTITEDAVEGYDTTYSEDGCDITNSHETEKVDVAGSKTWDDADDQDGVRPESITIRLLADGTEVDSATVTEEDNWSWSFTDLPKYRDGGIEIAYTITEDAIDEYATEYDGYDVTNKHTPDQTSVTVTKAWDDADNQDGIRPESVTVSLLADGEETGKTVELNEGNNWTDTFTELDMYRDHGEAIVYTVEEGDVPEGYTVVITGDAATGYTATNTHETETIEIPVEKIWEDGDTYNHRPDAVEVELLADGEETDNIITLSDSNDWTDTFIDLAKYRDGGVAIDYTVKEITPEALQYYTPKTTYNEDGSVTIVNQREYFDIDEEIVTDESDRGSWVKNESVNEYNAIELEMSTYLPVIEADELANGAFTMKFHDVLDSELILDEADADFSVYIGGEKISHDYYVVTLAPSAQPTRTLSLGDPIDDGCSFHVDVDLTALYLDGVITEADLTGDTEIMVFFYADLEGTDLNGTYKSTVWYEVYDGDNLEYTSSVDVVYVYTYEIYIKKYDAETGDALADATLGVFYDSECTDPVSRNGEPYTVVSGEDGAAIFYGLADGTYYVTELEAPEGYVLSDEVLTVVLNEELNDKDYMYVGEYANTPEPAPETVDVEGSKTWEDNDDEDGKRPESITINLLANGTVVKTVSVTEKDGWKWSFTDLDKYDADGKEIDYTIAEMAVPDYTTTYDGYDVMNTYEPEPEPTPTPETVDVEGSKTWEDDDDADGKRPESITIDLLANGTKVDTATVTEKDDWAWSFTELDKYDADGKEIDYTIAEEAVEDYTTTYDDYNVTNTYETPEPTPTPDTVEVKGSKTWDDNNDQDGKRPESITINLLANGTKVDTATVTEKDDWAWSFTDLAKEDADGEEITYTITEDAVENYTADVDGYDVTNTYVSEEPEPTSDKLSIPVTKVWDDDNDLEGLRPETVEIELYQNGESTGRVLVLSEENNWTGSFDNLDEYNEGVKNEYTVQEQEVGDYISEITGDAETGFTVTNTFNEAAATQGPGPATGGDTYGGTGTTGGTGGTGGTSGTGGSGGTSGTGTTKTDDAGNIGLWLVLAIIAAAAVVGSVTVRTRRQRARK